MKIIPVIYLKGNQGYRDSSMQSSIPVLEAVREADQKGADGIFIVNRSEDDKSHEEAITCCKEIARQCECPLYMGGNIHRFEDVKKYLYAGAAGVWMNPFSQEEMTVYSEALERFGKEKVKTIAYQTLIQKEPALDAEYFLVLSDLSNDYYQIKQEWKEKGYEVEQCIPSISWAELKKDEAGLIPCIVQDYRTNEVLMMAYMDEAAYLETARFGKMCYYSRSRKKRWLKGETSGHYQYVKSLCADCDKDTLLAKVAQVGAACHTGAHSCFFRSIFEKEGAKAVNPSQVLENVYQVIMDRKLHPKQGSYTNYLFDKGIDKILKKCGEEATEIVIAAKNPDPEEIKYEISDFLYHVMVLMAEKGITWEDITRELANR